jgi:hypothetical protein
MSEFNTSPIPNEEAMGGGQFEVTEEAKEISPLERPGTLTQEEAISLAESGWWREKSPQEIVAFQLFEGRLAMDFDAFHEAVEAALGRPVWTHEFAEPNHLRDAFLAIQAGERERDDLTHVFDNLDPKKTIFVSVGEASPESKQE